MNSLESVGKIKGEDRFAWPKTSEQELEKTAWTQEEIKLPERVDWNQAVDALIDGWNEKDPPQPVPRHLDQEKIILRSNGNKVATITRYKFRKYGDHLHPPGEARQMVIVGETPKLRLKHLETILENLKKHGANI